MPRITATDGIELITSMGLPVEVKTFTDVTVAERNARVYVRQTPPSPSSVRADDRENAGGLVRRAIRGGSQPHAAAGSLNPRCGRAGMLLNPGRGLCTK